jgi:hypothetical protein
MNNKIKYHYDSLYIISSITIFSYFGLNIFMYALLFKILFTYWNNINMEEAITYLLVYYFGKHFLIIIMMFAGIFGFSIIKSKIQVTNNFDFNYDFNIFFYCLDKINAIIMYCIYKIDIIIPEQISKPIKIVADAYTETISEFTNVLDLYFDRKRLKSFMYTKFFSMLGMFTANSPTYENKQNRQEILEDYSEYENTPQENLEDEDCINNLLRKQKKLNKYKRLRR